MVGGSEGGDIESKVNRKEENRVKSRRLRLTLCYQEIPALFHLYDNIPKPSKRAFGMLIYLSICHFKDKTKQK